MPGSTASSTRPTRFARFPSSALPLRMMSSAAGRPISRGSLLVPPHAGKMPSFTSGSPICAFGESDMTRQSQLSASSQPPPRQAPSIAATVVCFSFSTFVNTSCPRSTYAFA
jgi:hypothetical protein